MTHRSNLLNRVQEKHAYTAAEVAAVRAVLRLLPVFFLTMSYFTLYSHMFSIFVLQVQYFLLLVCVCFGCVLSCGMCML